MVDDARSRPNRSAANASGARSLKQRIADMEQRLALERTQVVAHSRAWRGDVRRRMTSPTSLFLAGGLGFIAAEIFAARSRKAASRGAGKPQGSLLKSVLGQIGRPLLSMLQLGSIGFLAKRGHDVKSAVETSVAPNAESGAYSEPPTLH